MHDHAGHIAVNEVQLRSGEFETVSVNTQHHGAVVVNSPPLTNLVESTIYALSCVLGGLG